MTAVIFERTEMAAVFFAFLKPTAIFAIGKTRQSMVFFAEEFYNEYIKKKQQKICNGKQYL